MRTELCQCWGLPLETCPQGRPFGGAPQVAVSCSFFRWVLADTADIKQIKAKVRYVGLCLVAALSGRRRLGMT